MSLGERERSTLVWPSVSVVFINWSNRSARLVGPLKPETVSEPVRGNMIPDLASIKDETSHAASDSGFPGRFRLVGLLALSEFEKARIDLVDGGACNYLAADSCAENTSRRDLELSRTGAYIKG